MTVILDELAKVQKLAAADAAGDGKAHGELLKGIRTLLLAAETPLETTSRLNFQVRVTGCHRTGSAFGDDPLQQEQHSPITANSNNTNFRSCRTSAFGSRLRNACFMR